ncbi:MAG: 50S ribosomal protein L16 [Candidatus Pacearchaeota archaeon]|nr:50S ribosomal protein L16 [Candidatus Pacearchaeota archaeon]
MALRKASAYSKKYARPFTRISRRKDKAYIKTVPYSKIVKFNFGNLEDYRNNKHKFIVKLITEEDVQIRDNALEASRMFLHKALESEVPGQYFFSVKVQPHHFLRDNKTATGAGADRTSTGMSHSYGIVVGRAALVPKGKEILMVSCLNEKCVRVAREALSSIKAKIPSRTKVVFEQK